MTAANHTIPSVPSPPSPWGVWVTLDDARRAVAQEAEAPPAQPTRHHLAGLAVHCNEILVSSQLQRPDMDPCMSANSRLGKKRREPLTAHPSTTAYP